MAVEAEATREARAKVKYFLVSIVLLWGLCIKVNVIISLFLKKLKSEANLIYFPRKKIMSKLLPQLEVFNF